MTSPLPKHEEARLDALHRYHILDTVAEQAYDDVTGLAAFITGAPISLVSLIDDDRQWFKSRVGLAAEETPREHAFCAHAILNPGSVLVVPDASIDPRFRDNPLVTDEPHIRFYAGAPLVSPEGHALGTVCVIDTKPRSLSEAESTALQKLSRQVVAQLELRRLAGELEDNATLQRAYQLAIEKANEQLALQSRTDSLTGLRNRRAFDETLHDELARTARAGEPITLLLIDVDHFKAYNDQFGHQAGDVALRQFAQVLEQNARPFDIVARYGGEEFAVMMPRTGAGASVPVAERLRQVVADTEWSVRAITASIGVATVTTVRAANEQAAANDLIARADSALYRAKQAGRNRVENAPAPG